MRHRLAIVLLTAVIVVGCSSSDDDPVDAAGGPERSSTTSTTTTQADLPPFEDPGDWLCHPDLADTPCTRDVTVTSFDNDGGSRRVDLATDAARGVDCFYVHPTVGEDAGKNGDLDPGDGEVRITFEQAAPLASLCRVFSPVYREATFHSLDVDDLDQRYLDIAYADIEAAFRAYLSAWNDGRPVILFGHSQGAIHIERLLASDLSTDLGADLIGAYVLGLPVTIQPDGSLAAAPAFSLCTALGQRGCVVAFSAYDAAAPPGDDALFGHPWGGGDGKVACTNPASLGATSALIEPLTASTRASVFDQRAGAVATSFVTYVGRFTAKCVDDGRNVYLEVSNDPDPTSPGADPIPTQDEPKWGLHAVEVGLTLGSLLDLMRAQIDAA
jgi:hypothetical protein